MAGCVVATAGNDLSGWIGSHAQSEGRSTARTAVQSPSQAAGWREVRHCVTAGILVSQASIVV
jgi:hypothetical protein